VKRAGSHESRPEPRAARPPLTPTTSLRAGDGVTVVERPVLENDYVERREVLVAPGMERPVRYLGSVLLPDLFRVASAGGTAAQAARAADGSFESAYSTIDWLYQQEYLVAADR
jgi:hypothetical protein